MSLVVVVFLLLLVVVLVDGVDDAELLPPSAHLHALPLSVSGPPEAAAAAALVVVGLWPSDGVTRGGVKSGRQ